MIENLKPSDNKDDPWISPEGILFQRKADYLQSICGFCLCGDVIENLTYIKDFLCKVLKKKIAQKNSDLFMLYWANKVEFLEHGGSVYGSWITDLGKEFIKDAQWCIDNESK
jgi:hypothetical protein